MQLDKLVINSILGESNEEALETVRQMRLSRVKGATLTAQKAVVSKTKKTVNRTAKRIDPKTLTHEQRLEILKMFDAKLNNP